MHLLAKGLAEEAEALEVLAARRPHPNIVGYHGCHVRRGYITGIMLDRHLCDLNSHLKNGYVVEDKEHFIASLESAIHLLHSFGWAHNDLTPTNVLVVQNITDYRDTRLVSRPIPVL